MAFKLTAEEAKTFEDLRGTYNQTKELLQHAVDNYNEILTQLAEFRDSLLERLQGEFDEKSEKWQESDKGSAVGAMIDEWENLNLEEIDQDVLILEDLTISAE